MGENILGGMIPGDLYLGRGHISSDRSLHHRARNYRHIGFLANLFIDIPDCVEGALQEPPLCLQRTRSVPKLSSDDIAVLQFLAAAELVETDLWGQYSELATLIPDPVARCSRSKRRCLSHA